MSPQHIHLPHPVHFPVSEKSDLILEDTPDLHPYAPDYYSAAGILPAADSAVADILSVPDTHIVSAADILPVPDVPVIQYPVHPVCFSIPHRMRNHFHSQHHNSDMSYPYLFSFRTAPCLLTQFDHIVMILVD